MNELGVERVVLARENTLDDIRAIRAAVPDLGLEIVHSRRAVHLVLRPVLHVRDDLRAQRQSRLVRAVVPQGLRPHRRRPRGAELDRGYLISAKDLGAYDHLAEIADAGIGCLKVEGRKKRPEYVATVTQTYREFLDRVEQGDVTPPSEAEVAAARADLQPRLHRRHVWRPRGTRLHHARRSPTIAASRSAPSSATSAVS